MTKLLEVRANLNSNQGLIMLVSQISDGSSIEIAGHDDFVLDVIWIDDSSFASCSKDKTIRIWRYTEDKWTQKALMNAHSDKVTSLAIDTSRQILVSASNDKTMRTWKYDTGESLHEFTGHTGPITCIDIDDGILVSGSSDSTARVWNIETGERLWTFQDKNLDIIASIKVSTKYNFVVAGSYDAAIRIWNYESQRMLKILKGHKDWVSTLSLVDVPDEENEGGTFPIIISGSYDTTIKLWEPKRKKKLRKMFSSKNKK